MICILSFAMVLLSGCQTVSRRVACTVYPVSYLIETISGGTVTPVSVLDDVTVQKSHMRSDYASILDDADAFMHIGTLEPSLSVYGEEISETGIEDVDLSGLNALYDYGRYTMNEDGSFTKSAYYDGDVFANVDTNEKELALWMDPIMMLSMARNISSWLSSKYPENKSLYEENMQELEEDLINLDAQYESFALKLQEENETVRFVTMSGNFGAWQNAYGFEIYPIVQSRYGVLPDEEQLNIIKARIVQDDVKYIVYEPDMSEDMIELFNTLEEQLGLIRVEMSSLSSLSRQQVKDGKDYFTIMNENLQVLEAMVPNEK